MVREISWELLLNFITRSITNAMNVIGMSPHWQYVFKGAVIVGCYASYYSSLKSSAL